MIPKNTFPNDEAEKKIDKIKEMEDILIEKKYYTKQVKIPMILENLRQ